MNIIDTIIQRLFHIDITGKQEALATTQDMGRYIEERCSASALTSRPASSRLALTGFSLEKEFKKLFEDNAIAMSFYNSEGYLVDLNDAMRKLCGFDAEGEKFFRETRLFDAPVFHDLDPSRRDSFYTCQRMFYPELGINRYIEVRVQPTFDKNERLQYYAITSRDVTEKRKRLMKRQKQEEELRDTATTISRYERQLNHLLKHSNMYVWQLDIEKQNIAFTRSLRQPDYVLTIQEYLDGLSDEHRQLSAERMQELLRNPKPFNDLYLFRQTPINAKPAWYAIDGIPVTDAEGHVISAFGLLRDVTQLMSIQQQLLKEQQRAEASTAMKTTFLDNMRQELRTPLSTIIANIGQLPSVQTAEERAELLHSILSDCDQLQQLGSEIVMKPAVDQKEATTTSAS